MTPWQRKARLLALIAASGVAIAVALAYKRAPAARPTETAAPADPNALVESAEGLEIRFNREQEEIRIGFKTATTYTDAPSKLQGVKVTTVRAGGRTFIVTADHAEVGQNETNILMTGNVLLAGSDGMEARTERATYTYADSQLQAPGPIEFSRGRLRGTGRGLTYAKNVDVLTIHEEAVVRVAAGEDGSGETEILSGTVEFSRTDHVIRFTRGVKVARGGQTIEADSATARLSEDEKRLEAVELRGNSRMLAAPEAAGGLTAMRGQNMDLKYFVDGETLEHALVTGEAVAQVGGGPGRTDRIISANTLDVSMAPDGSTPTALIARDNVQLTIPAEEGAPARSVSAPALDARGEPGRGLTHARFTGGVQFRERGTDVDRSARSRTLDAALAPGLSEIEDARFAQAVQFEAGELRAAAALARYLLTKGTLELTGSEPGLTVPQVVNDRISVYGVRIDVTLSGPIVRASGSVKSELKPPKGGSKPKRTSKMPSMFKQDQLVAATAGELLYDGTAAKATYSQNAQLWQGDTSIKAQTIDLDEQTGDLGATGSVVTTISLEQENQEDKGRKERVPTTGTSKGFEYEESLRRATYLDEAHLNGPQGDMTAVKIELYLQESGDEIERLEGYDAVILRDANRETRGSRMTYYAADDRYVVTGTPVVIKDECGRETTGKQVTFDERINTVIVVSEQTRTQTRGGTTGGATCP
jgi:lipopolysaccharide export system protein LptA